MQHNSFNQTIEEATGNNLLDLAPANCSIKQKKAENSREIISLFTYNSSEMSERFIGSSRSYTNTNNIFNLNHGKEKSVNQKVAVNNPKNKLMEIKEYILE